jgi:hypothetical protein
MKGPVPKLSAAALRQIAGRRLAVESCPCRSLQCAGWTTVPVGFDQTMLRRVGRVGSSDPYEEPTFEEHHPDGTRYDSDLAPIALDHFPYNRCDVWQCARCGRTFLRYTEFGGYYVDHRIREVDPGLVVEPTDRTGPAQPDGSAR